MRRVVLVDFSWVYHKAFHVHRDLCYFTLQGPVKTGAIFGTVRDLSILYIDYPVQFYVVTEPEENMERLMLSDTYKAGRCDGRDKEVYSQYEDALIAVSQLPFVKVISSNQSGEADDVIQSFILDHASEYDEFLVYANDNDLLQVAGKVPHVFYVKREVGGNGGRLYLKPFAEYSQEKYGVAPGAMLMYRSLRGDSSDNISAVWPRLSSKLAKKIAEAYATPQEYFEKASQDDDYKHLNELKSRWITNFQLLKHRHISVDTPIIDTKGRNLKYFLETYGCKSFEKYFAVPSPNA